MNPEANRAFALELLDATLKSWWTIVAGVCFGLAAAIVALHQTPKMYEATAKVLITPQQINQEFFESTVTEDLTRRMMALEEAVISESYMVRLIEEVFGKPDSPQQLESMIRGIRSRTSVRPNLNLQMGWLAFDLSFKDTDPDRAAGIANTLAELYIEQNTEFRTSQARDTTRTIDERRQEARAAFEEIDRRLNDFSAQHKFESEAHLDANLRMLEAAKKDLEYAQGNKKLTIEKQRQLDQELDALEAGANPGDRQIEKVRRELEQLLVSYSDAHPTVIRKRRELQDLISAGQGAEPAPQDPKITELRQQLGNVRLELTNYESQENRLRRQIREYNRRIQAVPEVQPQLTSLVNEHTLLRARYLDLQEKADKARQSQFLEESDRGSRFELAERARAPVSPYFPKPARFYPLGLVLGLALFLGPMMIRRLLQPPLASEAGMRAVIDVPVLISIPRITTPSNKGWLAKRIFANFSLSAICIAVLAAVKYLLH